MSNVIRAVFSGGARSVVTEAQYMWSKGQILLIEGLDLPTAFRVYFSNKRKARVFPSLFLGSTMSALSQMNTLRRTRISKHGSW